MDLYRNFFSRVAPIAQFCCPVPISIPSQTSTYRASCLKLSCCLQPGRPVLRRFYIVHTVLYSTYQPTYPTYTTVAQLGVPLPPLAAAAVATLLSHRHLLVLTALSQGGKVLLAPYGSSLRVCAPGCLHRLTSAPGRAGPTVRWTVPKAFTVW